MNIYFEPNCNRRCRYNLLTPKISNTSSLRETFTDNHTKIDTITEEGEDREDNRIIETIKEGGTIITDIKETIRDKNRIKDFK